MIATFKTEVKFYEAGGELYISFKKGEIEFEVSIPRDAVWVIDRDGCIETDNYDLARLILDLA